MQTVVAKLNSALKLAGVINSGYFNKNLQILHFCVLAATFQGQVNKPVLMAGEVFCASTIKASVD